LLAEVEGRATAVAICRPRAARIAESEMVFTAQHHSKSDASLIAGEAHRRLSQNNPARWSIRVV
jgi:hypothetical protein